jgi:hypothetical protein
LKQFFFNIQYIRETNLIEVRRKCKCNFVNALAPNVQYVLRF